MLVRSNVPRGRQTANAEASAACLRQHRVTGYAALETSISSRSALASSMRFTKRLLSCHREVALDPEVDEAASQSSPAFLRPRQLMSYESIILRL